MAYWMLADNDDGVRNILKVMFQVWGHQPIEFANGQEIFDYLDDVDEGLVEADKLPEFMLVEYGLSKKRGYEVSERIRQSPVLRHISILLIAFALTEKQELEMRNRYGVDYIIFKPFPDFDRFHVLIQEVITKRHAKNLELGWVKDVT